MRLYLRFWLLIFYFALFALSILIILSFIILYLCIFLKLLGLFPFHFIIIITHIFLTFQDTFLNSLNIFFVVIHVHLTSLIICRWLVVWISQQLLYWNQDGLNVINGRPVLFQNIQTDFTVVVYIWVEYFGYEVDFRGLIRVLITKLHS